MGKGEQRSSSKNGDTAMLVVVALSVNVRVVTHRDSFCVPVLLSTTLDERVTTNAMAESFI